MQNKKDSSISLPEGEFGEAGGPKTCGNSDLTNSSGIESPGKLSSFSVVDSCKYCGSNIQKPPFPGSSLVLLIFLKHLFKDKLWRIEFCKNDVMKSKKSIQSCYGGISN